MQITIPTSGRPQIVYFVIVKGIKYEIGTQHKLYNLRYKMIQRCYNSFSKPKDFKHYQSKGIQVCDEWRNDPESFFEWCLNNGWQEGLTLDRINPKGNYEPNNVRILTRQENGRLSNLGRIGQDAVNAILNDQQVREIKKMLKNKIKSKDIAKIFKVSPNTISAIKRSKNWSHIKIEEI